MKIVVWIVQIVLAAMFGMAGVMKSTQAIAELSVQVPWAADVPVALVRFIGVAELLAAIGLIVPQLTNIRPKMTVFAAAGLVVVQVLAMIFHITRGEYPALAFNLVLGGMAAFVAYQRNKQF